MTPLRLSWPERPLWPNFKAHWAVNKLARDFQREEAFGEATASGWKRPAHPVNDLHLTLTFCAPTARRYDLDGALSACKGAIDGISAALEIDDSLFSYTLRRGEKAKGGGVIVAAEVR